MSRDLVVPRSQTRVHRPWRTRQVETDEPVTAPSRAHFSSHPLVTDVASHL